MSLKDARMPSLRDKHEQAAIVQSVEEKKAIEEIDEVKVVEKKSKVKK